MLRRRMLSVTLRSCGICRAFIAVSNGRVKTEGSVSSLQLLLRDGNLSKRRKSVHTWHTVLTGG